MGSSNNRFAPLESLWDVQANTQSMKRQTASHPQHKSQPKPTYSEAVTSIQASSPGLNAQSQIYQPMGSSPTNQEIDSARTRLEAGESRGRGVSWEKATMTPQASKPRSARPLDQSRSLISRSQELTPTCTQDIGVLNEHLAERLGRGGRRNREPVIAAPPLRSQMLLNYDIRTYVQALDHSISQVQWIRCPAVPSVEEIHDSGNTNLDDPVPVLENIVVGPFASKDDYLERHYTLLREDAVAPLRSAVSEVQTYPHLEEKDSQCNAYLYEKVYITSLTFAKGGIAARITFSLRRVGKKVNWEQSKRLLTGTIVALTSASDGFRTSCCVGVVAARPLVGLQQNPPEIDLYFGAATGMEIDPQQEFLMVESRSGFYEGHRHTLQSLQMLAQEDFPLSEHIVGLRRDVPPPAYLTIQPQKNLSKIFPTGAENLNNLNVLTEWPDLPPACTLDGWQMKALRRIITKRLAIIQGPPGTGKTYISVMAIKAMLENMGQDDPPIVIASHTNHALDQLLRHVALFEDNFIRLGGWTKDLETIKPRTLYEIKAAVKLCEVKGGLRGPASHKIRKLVDEVKALLAPLTQDGEPFSGDFLHEHGIISGLQHESLIHGSKEWVRAGSAHVKGEVAIWLGDELIEAKQRTLPEDFGIEVEEADLEFEQLQELEAESKIGDDENIDTLWGPRVVFNERFTGRKTIGVTEEAVQAHMEKQDLWTIPYEFRGPVYRYMQRLAKEKIRTKVREVAQKYEKASSEARIGGWELDYNFLRQAKVIGATTTGLAKYRGLLQALNPKIVMIEEAAETLEAPVAVACFKSLEHLILVGDHQQLRAHCNEPELAESPFFLGISMFERLVRNGVEFSQLRRQRRMIPEISRLLSPVYGKLKNHQSVLHRPPIPGVSFNTYFFTHQWREIKDHQMSTMNDYEAEMIVGFFNYLMKNGLEPSDVTVLTFYNAQRKSILRKLRDHHPKQYFKVATIDSYQGEENTVILLSLVRSNDDGKIGFLEVENRVCVALSRAQRGLYIWGDGPALCKASILWWQIVQIMGQDPRRIGFQLPLACQKHHEMTFVNDPQDLHELDGGCGKSCGEKLECGHKCPLKCHPFPHDQILCVEGECGIKHELDKVADLSLKEKDSIESSKPLPLKESHDPHQPYHFRQYAAGGYKESDKNLVRSIQNGQSDAERDKLDRANFEALFGEPMLPKPDENSRLIRTWPDGEGGTRSVWKGIYNASGARARDLDSKQAESSLLDLL
ncbi:hypothetical protein ACLMJK_003102 [Lecanora helva]